MNDIMNRRGHVEAEGERKTLRSMREREREERERIFRRRFGGVTADLPGTA